MDVNTELSDFMVISALTNLKNEAVWEGKSEDLSTSSEDSASTLTCSETNPKGQSQKRQRGKYNCSKCGLPKVGSFVVCFVKISLQEFLLLMVIVHRMVTYAN
jgi:hypothetical protein